MDDAERTIDEQAADEFDDFAAEFNQARPQVDMSNYFTKDDILQTIDEKLAEV